MNASNARSLSNGFQDVRLVSLASWSKAAEISPRDRGGPYVVIQEGYAPEDITLSVAEHILGRSGRWLPIAHFYRMPVDDRRAEFIFGTAAEVMQLMSVLPSKVAIFDGKTPAEGTGGEGAPADDMAAAIDAGKTGKAGA